MALSQANHAAEAAQTLANALNRIRAVEGDPDAEGLRTVWHQCAKGADLLSTVDAQGQVLRQELTVRRNYFAWSADHGLASGHAIEGGSYESANASPVIEMDRALGLKRVREALDALSIYSGDDPYILHIIDALRSAIHSKSLLGPSVVTRSRGAVEGRQTPRVLRWASSALARLTAR